MELMRLVITGTPGAGKSAFVRTASDIGVVDTDRKATDATANIKSQTTVAFDFGRVVIGSSMELHVYGTPGQSRFNFMWDILIRRAHAYMLLVAAHRPAEIPQARQILSFMSERVQIPVVIGITHLDCAGAYSPEEILLRMGFTHDRPRPPVVTVDATNKTSVNTALNILLLTLLMARNKPFMGSTPSNMAPAQQKTRQRVGLTRS